MSAGSASVTSRIFGFQCKGVNESALVAGADWGIAGDPTGAASAPLWDQISARELYDHKVAMPSCDCRGKPCSRAPCSHKPSPCNPHHTCRYASSSASPLAGVGQPAATRTPLLLFFDYIVLHALSVRRVISVTSTLARRSSGRTWPTTRHMQPPSRGCMPS